MRRLAAQVHLGPFGGAGHGVAGVVGPLDPGVAGSGGFDALIPAEPQVPPRTDPGVLELAARLKREHPARTAAHIARIIAAEHGWAPSARTLQRHFARLELTTRPDGRPPKAFGRFEAAACDELWVSDGLHGPIIDGRRAVLFALLDDHSRYVVGHRWGPWRGHPGHAGRAARRGQNPRLPAAAVLRQRQPPTPRTSWPGRRRCWTSSWCTARPETAGTRERSNAGIAPCATSSWSRSTPTGRARRWKSSTGCSPRGAPAVPPRRALRNRRHPGAALPRRGPRPAAQPDPALLRRAFLWREQRKVTAFATVSLHGNRYEVDAALVGRTIDLLFTPFDLTVIEVEYQGRPMGPAARTTSAATCTPRSNPTPPRRSRPPASTTCGCSRTRTSAEVGQAINYPALADTDPVTSRAGRPSSEQPGQEARPRRARTLLAAARQRPGAGPDRGVDLLIATGTG